MANIIGSQSGKQKIFKNQNPLETLKDSQQSSGLLDQFFGNNQDSSHDGEFNWMGENKKPAKQQRKEFSIFNYQHYYEKQYGKA